MLVVVEFSVSIRYHACSGVEVEPYHASDVARYSAIQQSDTAELCCIQIPMEIPRCPHVCRTVSDVSGLDTAGYSMWIQLTAAFCCILLYQCCIKPPIQQILAV